MPEGLTGECPQNEDITHCRYFFQGLNPLYFLSNVIALQCLQTDFFFLIFCPEFITVICGVVSPMKTILPLWKLELLLNFIRNV